MTDFAATRDYDKELLDGEQHIKDSLSIKEKRKNSGNDYFLVRKRGMIRNPEYRKFMGGKNTIYEYTWCNIVRGKMHNDKHNIKEDYYDKGFLAYCSTYNHLAKKCFIDKNTAQKYMEEYEARGAIKIIKIGATPTKRDKRGRIIDRRPSVFILGTWQNVLDRDGNQTIQEDYWLEDIFYT